MIEKIKEYYGKLLINIFGIPPSIIIKQCSDELRKAMLKEREEVILNEESYE